MSIHWDSKTEIRFQERLTQKAKVSYRMVLGLAVVLFPCFSVLDWFSQREHFKILSEIRYITTVFFLWVYSRVRKGKFFSNAPEVSPLICIYVGGLSITLMTMCLDGYKSPYYAGVNLVILAAALLFPWGARRMGFVSFGVVMIYLIGVLIKAHFQIDDMPIFVNNTAFMISTAIIGVSSAYLSDRLRRESFAQHNVNDQVTHALQTRDEFISIASHELKTPLTVIRLQNDLLHRYSRGVEFDEEQRDMLKKHVERNDGQIRRLVRLIEDMLDLTRLNSGNMAFQMDPVDAEAMFRDLTDRFSSQLKASGMNLKLEFESGLIGVWDRMRVEQVLANLMNNAIKYAAKNPLALRLFREGKSARFEIQDFGKGIAKDRSILPGDKSGYARMGF